MSWWNGLPDEGTVPRSQLRPECEGCKAKDSEIAWLRLQLHPPAPKPEPIPVQTIPSFPPAFSRSPVVDAVQLPDEGEEERFDANGYEVFKPR